MRKDTPEFIKPQQAQIQFFVDLRVGGKQKTKTVTCPVTWKIAQL